MAQLFEGAMAQRSAWCDIDYQSPGVFCLSVCLFADFNQRNEEIEIGRIPMWDGAS